MANEEKLIHLANVIGEAKDRGEWDQDWWGAITSQGCETKMCAAGWQCVIEGKQLKYEEVDEDGYYNTEYGMSHIAEYTTDGHHVPTFAARSLGLTQTQADVLFYQISNDYETFVHVIKQIINGEIA